MDYAKFLLIAALVMGAAILLFKDYLDRKAREDRDITPRTIRIEDPEVLEEAYEQLMSQKERHLALPTCRHNKFYLTLIERKLNEIRGELLINLKKELK